MRAVDEFSRVGLRAFSYCGQDRSCSCHDAASGMVQLHAELVFVGSPPDGHPRASPPDVAVAVVDDGATDSHAQGRCRWGRAPSSVHRDLMADDRRSPDAIGVAGSSGFLTAYRGDSWRQWRDFTVGRLW